MDFAGKLNNVLGSFSFFFHSGEGIFNQRDDNIFGISILPKLEIREVKSPSRYIKNSNNIHLWKYSNTSGEYSIFYNPLKIRRGGREGQQSFVNVSSGKMEDENRSREGLVRSFTRYSILLSISIFHFHPSTPSIHSPASKREALRINLSLRRAEKRERKLINPYAFHFHGVVFHEGEKGVACFLRDFHASNPRFP